MNEAEFRLLEELEEDHWWFVGKRRILLALLARTGARGRFLDLGCGTGGVLRDVSAPLTGVGADRSRLALQICRQKGFEAVAQADLDALPFREGSFGTIVILDVLEHLEDDVGFLAEASRLCESKGRLLISVPAFRSLWSRHDETFGHLRRYSLSDLVGVVRAAGLVPEFATYTNALVFPVAAPWRLLTNRIGGGCFAPRHDFVRLPGWCNALLVGAYRLEALWLRRRGLPVGLSAACVARRGP